ncbi:type II toxin-antitoxin system MqsR family toxin [Lactobacillus sp. AN1001]
MDVSEALAKLKFLVKRDQFQLVQRRDRMAMPVSNSLAKEIIKQLSTKDFIKHEPNHNNPLQFVWIFKTSDGQTYYIKFVFTDNN